ncbi:TetR/AcrR family transcriptional regulator [Streptomyces oceani]|uniref:HTH tetR-type domain-containing protein n=1 Tax=Streptomyces oceani TaxID=1075402 RepID=A0A1E7KJ72_9ACTN|nr:TetR/AcrR family transcriptional regulator [Streptomyces oceani]OEV03951.1 hypothetical protein AN216_10060 [Streptomyces oceani]
MSEAPEQVGGKPGYHHGDLRNALIEAALGLAREGGPDAVVLRAAARQVGVSPTAAYRHFAGQGDLLFAVKERGQQELADSMEAAASTEPGRDGPAVERRLIAMGWGYVDFALRQPGLFRAAFCGAPEAVPELEPDSTGNLCPAGGAPAQFRSFDLLVEVLDELAASGRMAAERRAGAEVAAWSAAHGLATLLLDGPFAPLAREQRDAMIEQVLSTLAAGLTAS